MKRQNIRKLLLLISLLLFPITMWYFSPEIIMVGAAQHIMNGSFCVFVAMLVLSMFVGRVFCGYICPAAGLQENLFAVNCKNAKAGKRDYIKFVIWIVWIGIIGYLWITGKGELKVDPFFMTDHGISVSEIVDYITYVLVLVVLLLPSLFHGKRATCHYICWMAPFMIIGSAIGRKLHLPQLHVEADTSKCISCNVCNNTCSMGLDVKKLVQENGTTACRECINCGACVDSCPNKVLHYSFKWSR